MVQSVDIYINKIEQLLLNLIHMEYMELEGILMIGNLKKPDVGRKII